jgi:uncharacterized protein
MTPQEKDLVTQLLDRVKQVDTSGKDPEADALIRRGLQEKPDAPYVLAQTVLIQDMALNDAQRRIADLERQLAEAKAAPQRPTSFLGNVMNRGSDSAGSVPASGPWSRPASPPPAQSGVWGQPAAPAPDHPQAGYAQPGYGQPGYAPMAPMMGQGGGFLRSAATTAAGVAGGALLFEGIRSMFGGHAGLGSMAAAPGISETVINNYYGNEPGAPEGVQHAGWTPAGSDVPPDGDAPDPSLQYAADEGGAYDTDADIASDDDFGGDDSDLA